MFKKRIAFKLTAGFVVIVLLSMLTIGVFFIQMFKQYTFESAEKTLLERARNISSVVSQNTQSNGQMRGFGGFIRFLDTLAEAKVWITDTNGNPAVLYGMGMGYSFTSDPLSEEAKKMISEVVSGKEAISQSFSSLYSEETLTVGVPVYNSQSQVIGTVLLHAPVTGITSTLDKATSILLLSLIFALVLTIGLGIFYSLLFTRPLKAMNSTAIQMAKGNYSARTGINRLDEIGQLSESLDQLASTLDQTINQLYQEKGKMVDIISSISEGIVAFDTDLNPLSQNYALRQIMKRPTPYENEQLKNDFKQMGIDCSLESVIREKKALQTTNEWMDKKLKFTLSPILDNHSNVTGSVALVQDISESEHLEQLRKDFVANVSHEFRTPLTIIKGSLEAIIDGAVFDMEDIKRYLDRMLSETRVLERLVGDLLELSRLQSGKISFNMEKLNISNLISDVVKSMVTIAAKKDIKVEYSIADILPAVIGDYDRLRQLFVIFIDNAIKYSPEKTVITIVTKVGDSLEISIKDQGYGISADELPYIWDRFYKSDKTRKSNGSGLGLAIAKHLIRLHGGKVELQSDIGKGTKVTVYLKFLKE